MKELELPWIMLKGMTTDGAPSMIGKKRCLMGKIRREMDKQNPKFYIKIHCIIHQQSLCGKTLMFEHIIKVVVSVVNIIRSGGLNH
jgi:hypothetical protein